MLIIFDLDDTLYDRTSQVQDETKWQDIEKITLFPGVEDFLKSSPTRKILVTRSSTPGLQEKKIATLQLAPYFENIIICQTAQEKKEKFESIQQQFPQEEIWVVGDRRDTEIRYGNELKMKTILLCTGHYKGLLPQDESEQADFEISEFSELRGILP